MIDVNRETFDAIVKWLQGASNYKGGIPHEIDEQSHCLNVDGKIKVAAVKGYHDEPAAFYYRVDEQVHELWRKKFGYEIRF